MPQMFPLNWIFLFFYFLLFFIILNILNYYNYNLPINKKINNNVNYQKKYNWKW